MIDIERIRSGLQAIFDQLWEQMREVLPEDEIRNFNQKFFSQQKKINPLAASILSLKNGKFEIGKIDIAILQNHPEDIARIYQEYHKEIRKLILGFPELDVPSMTAAFNEDFSKIGFYEFFE